MKTEEQRLVRLHALVTDEVGGEPTSNLNVVPAALAGIYAIGECTAADVYRYVELVSQMGSVLYMDLSPEYLQVRLAIMLGGSLERISPKVAENFLFGRQGGYTAQEITANISDESKPVNRYAAALSVD